MNRIPTFMSEITQPGAQGITAQTITGSTKEIIGASKNTALSAPAGTTISLTMYFRKSAKLCSSPHGPTTFGPRRSCTAAQTLRSAYIRNARLTRTTIVTARHCARIRRKSPKPLREELHRRYSAAIAWPRRVRASRASSAITSLARMIGLAR